MHKDMTLGVHNVLTLYKGKPDRRDKNLDFRQVLARLSGLGDWKPDTRDRTSSFSPILSRLSGLPREG
ncbi:hypothetical protein cgp_2915 [Corynebacterium glutamicum MB001]|uniref:Uncharacterized protein n=1 Tax=Corynebacterium glutamicum (strain ATCC 13032 / DSM 20300 / JCM 1318 / BCRC 11384 / CCUG 27702 / LMG 3730 / NBRC 12168 / NCIMB 10025 / NRRL B-2784 / 534) TaxID=196627 RepID=Q8NME6_CORGL|nr:hypothetical protein cgp_2915 [Corynebacterium glutamicum MB001]ARV66151.1 hypothetical protein B7P23_15320 [Corynebacterium glutamicum]CAF21294.1 hypothetical protein cg2915 [Corynebacterium glutamicum ATCC 13032]CCH25763.1 hypothetical protein WA5_2543 [Corynebacterium glutamicum K051]ASW14948.1 hypothetical protein cgc1_2915 [Corynebacterium glutamicum]